MMEDLDINKLMDDVAKEIEEYLQDYGVKDLILFIKDDDFIVKEKNDAYNDYFYCRVNRKTLEVDQLKMKKMESLQRINDCAEIIINTLSIYNEEFNKLFGIKVEYVDDVKENMEFLLNSEIDKTYMIGKEVKLSYTDYSSFYGLKFNPSGYFNIELEDKKKCFYVEFDKDFVDLKELGEFLNKVLEKNKSVIDGYVDESKENLKK